MEYPYNDIALVVATVLPGELLYWFIIGKGERLRSKVLWSAIIFIVLVAGAYGWSFVPE